MKKLLIVFLTTIALATKVSFASSANSNSIIYFHRDGCSHCANANKFFEENDFYNKYQIISKEINNNRANARHYTQLMNKLKIPMKDRGVPAIFFGEEYVMIKDSTIISLFEEKADEFIRPHQENKEEPIEQINSVPINVTLPVVIGGAIADSINPCAFAVLIILLTTIISAGGRKRALKAGLLFATSIFISYFAMGLGIYKALSYGTMPYYFMKIVGGIALLFGLLNIKDYFWYDKSFFKMEVPESWRPKMKAILAGVISPAGAFAAGFIISLFLLPCTSGPYIAVLGMLSQKEVFAKAIAYLIIYNLVFVSPMIIITVAVYKGFSVEKAEKIRLKKIRLLHLAAGILLIGMGLLILLGAL